MTGGTRKTGSGRNADPLLVMGRLAAPYGVKGWLRVVPFTQKMEALLDYSQWLVGHDGNWQTVKLLNGKPHGKGLVVQLQDCTDRDTAAHMTGEEIAVYRSQLPRAENNEYYWNDLIGMQVETLDGQLLGRVDHLIGTGANDVLVVRGERERLVPFVQEQVVREVDFGSAVIRVDWDADF